MNRDAPRHALEKIDDLVAARDSALLVIDVQNDFCAVGGALDRHGYDMSAYPVMIARLDRLLSATRQAGALVVYVRNLSLTNGLSDSPSWRRFRARLSRSPDEREMQYTLEGTWGAEIVSALAPHESDAVVHKYRSSAFAGTPLDLLMRSNGIRTILVTGCTTEGCVESTARDAMFFDYHAVIVEDCVASDTPELHEALDALDAQPVRHRLL